MPIRSHVDLALFVRFIHVRPGEEPPGTEQLLASPSRSQAWAQVFTSNLGTNFHEAYHFWQGLRLPFLHRYALISLRVVMQAFEQLDLHTPELHDWDCILPELSRLSLASRWHSPSIGAVNVSRVSRHEGPGIDLTPLDLLEGAASIAQWQTTSARGPDRSSWTHFSRWSKRTSSYTDALNAVAKALGDPKLALRCFIPMVNAAFHTSEPVLTLGYLTCFLMRPELKSWIEHPEPCRWGHAFGLLLDQIPFDGEPDADAAILGSPYHRVTQNWFGTTPAHPMLTKQTLRWSELERDDSRYTMLLDNPGYVDGDFVSRALLDFAPLTVTRIHATGGAGFMVAAGDAESSDGGNHFIEWRRVMTAYGTVRRAAGVHYDPETRLCHHADCPEYELNYCNCYPAVLKDFRNCQFIKTVSDLRRDARRSSTDHERDD